MAPLEDNLAPIVNFLITRLFGRKKRQFFYLNIYYILMCHN